MQNKTKEWQLEWNKLKRAFHDGNRLTNLQAKDFYDMICEIELNHNDLCGVLVSLEKAHKKLHERYTTMVELYNSPIQPLMPKENGEAVNPYLLLEKANEELKYWKDKYGYREEHDPSKGYMAPEE